MATITSFFRKTPVPSLQAYFETKSFNLPPSVVWTESESDVASALIAALDSLAEADREALILARIIHQELADVVYPYEISYDFAAESQNTRIQRPHPPWWKLSHLCPACHLFLARR
jgi:hypothetical protein